MDRMSIPIEWKAADESGVLEGYAAAYALDLGGDVIAKGAFAETIREDINKTGIPLLADHMPTTSSVLGTIFEASEDSHGLKVKARFSSAPSAQDVYVKAKEGHLRSMSIGYRSLEDHNDTVDDQPVRVLDRVKLFEASVVVFPMNPEATIARVKALASDLPEDDRKALAEEIAPAGPHIHFEVASGEGDEPAEQECGYKGECGPETVQFQGGESVIGQPVKGWDRWRSIALLEGRDPDAPVDPAERLRVEMQLDFNDDGIRAAN